AERRGHRGVANRNARAAVAVTCRRHTQQAIGMLVHAAAGTEARCIHRVGDVRALAQRLLQFIETACPGVFRGRHAEAFAKAALQPGGGKPHFARQRIQRGRMFALIQQVASVVQPVAAAFGEGSFGVHAHSMRVLPHAYHPVLVVDVSSAGGSAAPGPGCITVKSPSITPGPARRRPCPFSQRRTSIVNAAAAIMAAPINRPIATKPISNTMPANSTSPRTSGWRGRWMKDLSKRIGGLRGTMTFLPCGRASAATSVRSRAWT